MRSRFLPILAASLAPMTLAQTALAQSTAFTYQGELKSGGTPANGLFDLRYRVFNLPTAGVVVGTQVCVDNVPVTNGKFTVTIDLGQIFATTQGRYLEVDVRTDTGLDCADATGFGTLSPRQTITATPLANFAKSAGSAFALDAPDASPSPAVSVDNAGNVGIGTTAPTHNVHIASTAPTLALQDTDSTTQQVGYISYRDSSNVERGWVGYGSPGDPDFSIINVRTGGDIVLNTFSSGGNVGIGTPSPAAKLDVRGDVRLGSTGQYYAVKSSNNDRIIRGYVNANGTINAAQSGGGFSVSTGATGVYTVTFSTAFTSTPTVVVGPTAQCCKPRLNGASATSFTVHVNATDAAFTLTNSPFTFIAIGQ